MMTCPHCQSTATTERPDCTVWGYRRFRCRACRRGFNERTGMECPRIASTDTALHLTKSARLLSQKTVGYCYVRSFTPRM
jgi:transposase-like protein